MDVKDKIAELFKYPLIAPKPYPGIEICDDHPMIKAINYTTTPKLFFDSYSVASAYIKNSNSWCLMPENLISFFGLETLKIHPIQHFVSLDLVCLKNRSVPKEIIDSIFSNL